MIPTQANRALERSRKLRLLTIREKISICEELKNMDRKSVMDYHNINRFVLRRVLRWREEYNECRFIKVDGFKVNLGTPRFKALETFLV